MVSPNLSDGRIFYEEVADDLKKFIVRRSLCRRAFIFEHVELFEKRSKGSEGKRLTHQPILLELIALACDESYVFSLCFGFYLV